MLGICTGYAEWKRKGSLRRKSAPHKQNGQRHKRFYLSCCSSPGPGNEGFLASDLPSVISLGIKVMVGIM